MSKTRNWIIAGAAALLIVGAGSYTLMNNYLGNNVEIEQVIPASGAAATAPAASNAAGEAGSANTGNTDAGSVTGEELNGLWNITAASKVYFSVTTSRETVNFENSAVTGNWTINLEEQGSMKGEGTLDLTQINSGNSQRDGHVKQAEFFNTAEFPQANFTTNSIEGLPSEWTDGTVYDFTMNGTLTVRGVEKEVVFAGKALYADKQVKLSATTTVTFADFGMTNPHSVVLSTENDIAVQLELVLENQPIA
jgi:polyisoprenoid-binding protein YceI